MQDWHNYAGFFRKSGTPGWQAIAAEHAQRLGMEADQASAAEFVHPSGARIAIEMTDAEWNMFGVFGMRADLFTPDRARDTAACLLSLSDGLQARFARSYGGDVSVPMNSELTTGPDSLDWLQYFCADVAQAMPARLEDGPFHDFWRFASGGAGISLGVSPLGDLLSCKAAAGYLGITLRPIRGRNPATGAPISLNWA
jgi:hypothetical protein